MSQKIKSFFKGLWDSIEYTQMKRAEASGDIGEIAGTNRLKEIKMYTTKEIQDMFQIDTVVEKSKEVAKQVIDFNAIIGNASVSFFDSITDRKFTTYTEQAKKGVNQVSNAAEKFIDGFVVPQVSGSGSKN